MVVVCVTLYLLSTVAIGLYAASRVHGAKDFMVAGRSLPLYMNFACVFATWFGAETLLSISATFAKDGLTAVSGDPFGAAVCLAFVALFFARAFYRMDLLTIGDFYHKRYGKTVEVFTSLAITISYLGWTSAQLTALGLVLWVLGKDYFGPDGLNQAILIGAFIVFIYTVFGGMWSVALTDLVQTAAIVIGLIIVAILLGNEAGGFSTVIQHAHREGKFQFFPTGGSVEWWAFAAAFITFAFGSIPQQDVFQRVTSAKNEATAVTGTLLGGMFYFVFAFVPMFIAYSAVMLDPSYATLFASEDQREIQQILPNLILNRTPVWCQVLFFGALLSAILSTASGTLLAPSSLFTENVLRPFIKKMSDQTLLWTLRSIMVVFAIAATWVAMASKSTMYEMVQNAYKVTLVGAFVPLVAGVYWKRASTQGAVFAIIFGVGLWLLMEWQFLRIEDTDEFTKLPQSLHLPSIFHGMPPQIYGLVAAIVGMIVGSLLPKIIPHATVESESEDSSKRRSPIVGH
jgi:solute:Na+ symporter, SSS family